MVDTTLSHYHLRARLGSGGMGEVFLARDDHLQRDVAIKVLRAGTLAGEAERRGFKKEALALSRLSHPNIETVFDFDSAGGIDFLVMEYIPGSTLAEKLSPGPLSESETVELGIQLTEGLAAAHGEGVIHRDLKPANLRLTPDGRLKILDFGVAKMLPPPSGAAMTETVTSPAVVQGTLPYMAPEQLRGEPADERVDIYGAGVVLYEMCTGRLPFEERTAPALAGEILHKAPTPLRKIRPELSATLEQVVLRCLEKQPERRYQKAQDLRDDLARLTVTSTLAVQPRPTLPRSRWWAAGTAVLALVVAVIWMGREAPALAFSNRDWLVVADFENLTGETVFDKSLDTALRTSLEQSSYVNIIPRQRMNAALQRMKRSADTRVTEAIGREIAEREGAKALLSPGITGVGGNYLLSAVLRDPVTGASAQSGSVRAKSRGEVLPALDTLCRQVRRRLGESINQIARQAKPLSQVTTSSLEALKQYSLGIERLRVSDFEEARTYYENALAIDPEFAAATASLGMLHFERFDKEKGFDREKGKALLSKAVRQVDALTDRERLGILAFHARAVDGALPKAIELMKARLALYPDDSAALNNLAWFSRQANRFAESEKAYKEALRTDPRMEIAANGLASLYLYKLGRLTDAIELEKKQIASGRPSANAYDTLGFAYLGKSDYQEARKAYDMAVSLNPRSSLFLFRLAHTYRLLRDYPKAVEVLQRIPAVDPGESIHYDLGVNYFLMKQPEKARRNFQAMLQIAEKDARANPKDLSYRLVVAAVRARLRMPVDRRLLEPRRNPPDPEECFAFANLYALQDQPGKAVDELETAISNGYSDYVWIKIHPDHESLAKEPRFEELLKRTLR